MIHKHLPDSGSPSSLTYIPRSRKYVKSLTRIVLIKSGSRTIKTGVKRENIPTNAWPLQESCSVLKTSPKLITLPVPWKLPNGKDGFKNGMFRLFQNRY